MLINLVDVAAIYTRKTLASLLDTCSTSIYENYRFTKSYYKHYANSKRNLQVEPPPTNFLYCKFFCRSYFEKVMGDTNFSTPLAKLLCLTRRGAKSDVEPI